MNDPLGSFPLGFEPLLEIQEKITVVHQSDAECGTAHPLTRNDLQETTQASVAKEAYANRCDIRPA